MEGRRPRGWPTKSWKNRIKEALDRRGIDWTKRRKRVGSRQRIVNQAL